MVARCTFTISFITLRLSNIFPIGQKYLLNLVLLTWSQKHNQPRGNVHSKNWQSDTSTFFLDRGELVYVLTILEKQITSNCSVNLNIELTTNKNCCRQKRFSKVRFGSVFRRIEDKLHIFSSAWLKLLVMRALCPSRPLRQKKGTVWNQTFLKSESGEESEKNTTGF